MVVGSKSMGSQKRSFIRVLGSQLYILFTQMLFGLSLSDYSIGSKGYRKKAIASALPHMDSWTGYVFELCLFLNQRKAKIIQVGIDCDDNRRSHFNIFHEGFYRYWHLFKCWRLLQKRNSWFYTA